MPGIGTIQGFCASSQAGGALLFHFMSKLYERTSLIITTNLSFAEWPTVFGQVLPDNRLVRYHLDIRRVVQRGLTIGLADGRMAVDGREIYTARNLKVCLFTSMEAFEGKPK